MFRPLSIAAIAALAITSSAFAKNDALSLIPNDAVTVGVVHIADLRSSPLASTLFHQTDQVSTNGDAEKFLVEAGLQPSKDIDLLMVATSPRTTLGADADVLLAADGRFNVDRLTKALIARGAVKKSGYLILPHAADSNDRSGAVAFPDSHLAIIGSEAAVTEALANRAAGGTTFLTASGLGRDVARIDPKASAWAIVDVARASRLAGGGPHVPARNDSGAALQTAIKNVSTIALWATDSGDALKLGAFGIASDPETLQLLEDTLRGALAAMRLAVQDKAPDMVGVLRRFEVSRTSDTVQINGSVPAETLKTFVARQHAHAHAEMR